MKSIIEFVKRHSSAARWTFYTVMAIGVVLVAKKELAGINGPQMAELISELSPTSVVLYMILGVLAFTATGAYDIFASRHFGIELRPRTAMKIGWIAQAFNNFAGLGGLTGGTIRTKYYEKAGATKAEALNVTMCVWAANLIGLFVMLLATLPFAFRYDRGLWIIPLVMSLYVPLYFFGQKIKIGKFDLTRSPLALQNGRQKLEMTVASLLDWVIAGLFFWVCVRIFIPEASPLMALFVYATSTLVGLLSFVPGGVGTFDLTCITLFTAMGYDTTRLLLAILIYRVAYYVIPWILATLYAASELVSNRLGWATDPRKREDLVISILWIGVLLSGVILIISAITPGVYDHVWVVRFATPRFIHRSSSLSMLLIGMMLVILSRGIRQRIARIYTVSLVLLSMGALGAIVNGLNWQEALFLSFFAVLLFAARDSFINAPLQISWKSSLITVATVVSIPILIFIWRTHHYTPIPHPYPHRGGPIYLALVYTLMVTGISVALLFSRGRRLEFRPPTDDDVATFERFLAEHGGNEYSHLYFLGDKQVYYSEKGDVALMYRPDKNNLIILGDPIGREEGFEDAIDEFLRMAEDRRMNVAIYELSARYLTTCADQGFTFVKIGEDAMLDLSTYSNVGNKGKVFRRMRNRMGEKGTHFEMLEPPFSNELLAELRVVSDSWLGERDEMGFSLGRFDTDYLGRAPIAVVRGPERIEGFASLMPGHPNVASIDLMRIRPDAPGGTMDGIFVSLIEWARDSGYEYYNLGMAPMSNTGNAVYSGSKQKVIRYIYDFGNRAYNFKGLRSYKEKFKPDWTSRYLVYRNASTLASTLISVLSIIHRPTTVHAIRATDHASTLSSLFPMIDESDADQKAAIAQEAGEHPPYISPDCPEAGIDDAEKCCEAQANLECVVTEEKKGSAQIEDASALPEESSEENAAPSEGQQQV